MPYLYVIQVISIPNRPMLSVVARTAIYCMLLLDLLLNLSAIAEALPVTRVHNVPLGLHADRCLPQPHRAVFLHESAQAGSGRGIVRCPESGYSRRTSP